MIKYGFLGILFIVFSLSFLKRSRKSIVPISLFYLTAILYFTFLGREQYPQYQYSLTPFSAIRSVWNSSGKKATPQNFFQLVKICWSSFKGIALNILMFIPFGILVPCYIDMKREKRLIHMFWIVIILL